MVVSVLLNIKFGHAEISVPKIGYRCRKMAQIPTSQLPNQNLINCSANHKFPLKVTSTTKLFFAIK